MKQYIYSAAEIGLREWPSGTLRLAGIEITTNPEDADLFVCPGPLMLFQDPDVLDRFPYMKGCAEKHVFFDVSDYQTIYRKPCIFIRCNTRNWYYNSDINTISWAWPVEDYAECIDVPGDGFKFDVSFQGWISTDTRRLSAEACRDSGLKADIAMYPDFCGYIYDQPEGVRRRAEFRRSMRESRVALCPESIPGVFPYRFFEAMSAGRVPMLVASDYVLPFSDRIPYSEFCLFVDREQARHAGIVLRKFLKGASDQRLIEMGLQARHYWKRYLNREDWPRRMAEEVLLKIAAMEHTSCA